MLAEKNGVALGSPVSPILGNLFMSHKESNTFANDIKLRTCFIYVDDTISVIKSFFLN